MIHILGVDGVGKTTVLAELEKSGAKVLRCPQFHLSTDAKKNLSFEEIALSEYFDNFGKWADQLKRPDLKAWSLFYSMSLYAKILSQYAAKFDFAERYPSFDIRIYAPIYLHLLQDFTDKKLSGIDFALTEFVRSYLKVIAQTDDLTGSVQFIFQELNHVDSKVYSKYFPDFTGHGIILLEAQLPTIQARLQMKSATQEYHEKSQFLLQIQAGYRKLLLQHQQGWKQIIQVDAMTPQELSQTLFQLWQKYL